MNNFSLTKTIAISVAVSLIVVGAALWLVGSQSGQNFGATIGATFFPHSGVGARSFKVVTSTTDNTPATDGVASLLTVHAGALIEGGAPVSITTTSTLTAAQVCLGNPITVVATGTLTLTFPAATSTNSTANCLTNDGDFTRFFITVSSTSNVVLATTTGDTISKGSGASSTLTLASATLPYATVTVLRINSSTDSYFVGTFGPNQ